MTLTYEIQSETHIRVFTLGNYKAIGKNAIYIDITKLISTCNGLLLILYILLLSMYGYVFMYVKNGSCMCRYYYSLTRGIGQLIITSLPSGHFLTSGTRSRRSRASSQRSKAHRLDVVTREFFHVSRRHYGTSQGAYLHNKTRRHFGASVSLTYFVSAARKTTR